MKKLGLVGGMGPESTIPYYHNIVYSVQEALGKSIFPELSIESVNVFNVLKLCDEKKYDELTEYLMGAINNLAKSGAEFAALSANTPHIVFDRLKEQSPIPLISIVEATCEEAKHRKLKKIGLLGTIFTMTGEFFKAPFAKNGIQVVIPTKSEMGIINEKISTELELGIVKEETLLFFQNVINRMKSENGIEAIVLGCTELPLLLNDEVSSVPCLDTMQIHINSIVKTILAC
ncbi:MAG: amino acid racemase [Ruminococcus sp.]|nr:amino acid racemase [Ruminococcus sp.]